jgi:hypothetical protein
MSKDAGNIYNHYSADIKKINRTGAGRGIDSKKALAYTNIDK